MKEENKDKVISALQTAAPFMGFSGGILGLLVANTISAATKSEEVTENGEIDEIRTEAARQEAALKMAEVQARVAQEIAIAQRIENAEDVEIEEFYDYSGEGNAGLKTDGSTIGIGLGVSGKRVSRRVYRFKGFHGEKTEIIQDKNSEEKID